MRIRPEQLAALTRRPLEGFLDAAMEVVRRHWPGELAAGEPQLRQRLREATSAAEERGFRTRQHALRYINIALALGGNDFPQRFPWAERILGDPRLTPDARLSLLADKTADHLEGRHVD